MKKKGSRMRGRGRKWDDYGDVSDSDVNVRLSVTQSVEYSRLFVYEGISVDGTFEHRGGGVGFFGVGAAAQPVGVSAAQALETLGLGANLLDVNTFDGLLDTEAAKSGFAGHCVTVDDGEALLTYRKFVPESGGLFTGDVGVDGLFSVFDSVDSHLIPALTDTYDLGSSVALWRHGWISELDTVLFAENTVTLLGGWFVVSKDAGTLAASVDSMQTTIDFGKAMTQNDFVVLRASLAVEYIQIGTLVSGTTYNVTRDIDGSGGSVWPQGQPFMVLGNVGDGRIEFSAYTTPRIQILEQGAVYNAQTELIRLGDLNGNWGYSAEGYGIALGEYAANRANLTWDSVNGLRMRTYNQTIIQLDNAGNARIGANVVMDSDGIAIVGASSGNYENGNGYRFVDGSGTAVAGLLGDVSGNVSVQGNKFEMEDIFEFGNVGGGFAARVGDNMEVNGHLQINQAPVYFYGGDVDGSYPGNIIEMRLDSGAFIARIGSDFNSNGEYINRLRVEAAGGVALKSRLKFFNGFTQVGDIGVNDSTWLRINQETAKNIYTPRFFRADGGLSAGYAGTPGGGNVAYSGSLKSYKNGVRHNVYGFHPLANYITLASGVTLTGSNYTGTSLTYGSIPSGASAIVCRLHMKCTVASGWVAFGPGNGSGEQKYQAAQFSQVANLWNDSEITINIATNQRIYRTHYAAGGTLTYYLLLIGYYI